MGSRLFLYVVVCTANLAGIAVGICFGWTSPVLSKLEDFMDAPVTEEEASWIGSLFPIGATLSPLAAGYFADKCGRKKTLIVSFIPMVAGFILAAFGKSIIFLYTARFLFGLSAGVMFMVLPIYVGEISDNEVRGAMTSYNQVFTSLGIFLVYLIGTYVSVPQLNCMCLSVPICFIVGFSFMPESPHFYVANNNFSGAEKSLARLRSLPRSDVQKELAEIRRNVEDAMACKGNMKDMLSGGNLKATYLTVGLVFFQQFAGINVVLFYAQDIFRASGSTLSSSLSSIIIGFIQVLSSFASPILVDRLGRRVLLIFSAAGAGLSQIVLGYYFYAVEGQKQQEIGGFFALLPVICLITYIITYCCGYGSIPWAVVGEIFPANIKALATSAIVTICLFLAFLITKYFKSVAEFIGTCYAFWIFAGFAIGGGVFVFFLLPETKGKSFQEIQDILNGRNEKNREVLTGLKYNDE